MTRDPLADFFRFPHTPHLAWQGTSAPPRSDKLLTDTERREFLSGEVVVEEKVDGANLGFSLDATGRLRAQNRGSFLDGTVQPQFRGLHAWLATREAAIASALGGDLILFGEWCEAVHSIRYTRLPDWFLVFDVYDRRQRRFWSTRRRDELARELGLATVPFLARGRLNLGRARALLGPSRVGTGPAEGVYFRREDADWLLRRAKLVRPEFVQAIDEHWTRRRLECNALAR